MRLVFRIVGFCALFFLAIICAAGGVLKIIYVRDARRAEALLSDVRSLRAGGSPSADVLRVVRKYGGDECRGCSASQGCPSPDDGYGVGIGNHFLNDLGMRFPFFSFVLQPRGAAANFLLKDGRLCWIAYSVSTRPNPKDWPVGARGIMVPAGGWSFPEHQIPYRVIDSSGKLYVLEALAESSAPVEYLQRTFALDLSCLGRIGGCRTACELFPSAWLEVRADMPFPYQLSEPWCDKSTLKKLRLTQ